MACGISVLQPGIKPECPVLEVQSLNHWTTWNVPRSLYEPLSKSFKWQGASCSIPELWGITAIHMVSMVSSQAMKRSQKNQKEKERFSQKAFPMTSEKHNLGHFQTYCWERVLFLNFQRFLFSGNIMLPISVDFQKPKVFFKNSKANCVMILYHWNRNF